MAPRNLLNMALASSLLLAGLSAKAEKVIEVRNWSLWDSSSGDNPNGSCVISTKNTALFRTEVYFLELVKVKNKVDSPVEVFIRVEKNKRGSTGFIAELAESHLTFSELNTDQRQNFWGIAKNLSHLVAQLKADASVDVEGVGGSKGVSFSFSSTGFKEVLTEMERRCNNGRSLINHDFEASFLGDVAASVNPLVLSKEATAEMRSLYFQVFPLFLQLRETQTALGQVLAKYQPFINELGQVKDELSQIHNIRLPNAKKALADALKLQTDSQAEIARLTALIPSLQAEVQSAQKISDSARAIIAPHEGEYNRLTSALSSSRSLLSEAEGRLRHLDNQLALLGRELASLSSEADGLRYSIAQRRSELDHTYALWREAEHRRSHFNISIEEDRRLRSNHEYISLINERSSLEQAGRKIEQDARQARGERDRVAGLLAQCKATPPAAAVTPVEIPEQPAGAENGDLPSENADPNVVGSIASADCSELERALQAADSRVHELERGAQEVASRQSQINGRLSELQRQISHQVRREYDILAQRERDLRIQHDNIQTSLRRDESRFNQIVNSEIPYREREQAQILAERPQVLLRIQQLTAQLDGLNKEFALFKANSDWDKKKADVDMAADRLAKAQAVLSSAQSQKAFAERRLNEGKTSETQAKGKIKDFEGRIVALNQRAVELDKAIAPLAGERSPLDARISDLEIQVAGVKDQFLRIIH